MKWKHAVTGVPGTSHILHGLVCQDFWGVREVGEILICAISDGAGSAKYSDRGSLVIVTQALDYFQDLLGDDSTSEHAIQALDQSHAERLVIEIRHALAREANSLGTTIHELAGTMLVAIFHRTRSVFYQVGDGVWCVSHNGVLGAVTWPHQGEYAGQTEFVTSPNAADSIQFGALQGMLDFAVGMSDGLERLSLNMQARVPHPGFIDPLIVALKANHSPDLLIGSLHRFLNSDQICERTDDDKCIALITHE